MAIVMAAPSCAPVAAGEDPVLVRAQQTYLTARDSFDLLFNIELDNRDLIEQKLPGTHKVVNDVKVRAKQALPALLSAIDTYKINKDKDKLSLWLAVVEDLLRSAQAELGKVSAAAIPIKAAQLQELKRLESAQWGGK
jgi:hypothetical protein